MKGIINGILIVLVAGFIAIMIFDRCKSKPKPDCTAISKAMVDSMYLSWQLNYGVIDTVILPGQTRWLKPKVVRVPVQVFKTDTLPFVIHDTVPIDELHLYTLTDTVNPHLVIVDSLWAIGSEKLHWNRRLANDTSHYLRKGYQNGVNAMESKMASQEFARKVNCRWPWRRLCRCK